MRITRHGLGLKSCYWRAVCSLLFIFQIPSGIEDVFSNRRKILAEDWAAYAVERCGFFSDVLSHIHTVAASVLEGRVGLGGPIPKGPERSVLLVPGNKGKWLVSCLEEGYSPPLSMNLWFLQASLQFLKYRCHFNFSLQCVQSPTWVWLFATPWPAAHQASLSLTISQNLSKFKSIASVMPSHPLKPLCPSALNLCQHQGLFHRVGHLYQMTKVLGIHHQSLQWVFRVFP